VRRVRAGAGGARRAHTTTGRGVDYDGAARASFRSSAESSASADLARRADAAALHAGALLRCPLLARTRARMQPPCAHAAASGGGGAALQAVR
jgi:hypothetical protein